MAEDAADLIARWRYPAIGRYVDVADGALAVHGERLSVLNAEQRSIALTAAEMRVEDLVAELPNRALAQAAVDAVEKLYLAGTEMSMWSPDTSAYVRATWGVVFTALAKRGFRLHYVVEHLHAERIGRPLELYPDLFAAGGVQYVCPHVFANLLPEAHEAEVTPEALAPFLGEGRTRALAQARAIATEGGHLAYVEVAPEPGAVDQVLALVADTPGTIGIHRVGLPVPGTQPVLTFAARGPSA